MTGFDVPRFLLTVSDSHDRARGRRDHTPCDTSDEEPGQPCSSMRADDEQVHSAGSGRVDDLLSGRTVQDEADGSNAGARRLLRQSAKLPLTPLSRLPIDQLPRVGVDVFVRHDRHERNYDVDNGQGRSMSLGHRHGGGERRTRRLREVCRQEDAS